MIMMKKRIFVVLSILALICGFCYSYEVKVTNLIHESMIHRSQEMTEDAATLLRIRLQEDSSEKNRAILKKELNETRMFGTKNILHWVDVAGNSVLQNTAGRRTSLLRMLPEIKEQNPQLDENNLLQNKSLQGIYTMQGEKYCLSYAPIGINNWYVAALVPIDKAFVTGQMAIQETFRLLVTMVLVFALAAFYIIYAGHVNRKKLYEIAYYDDITTLGNKNMYFTQMAAIAKDKQSTQIWCLLLFNLRNFRRVNDIFGLPVGNKVLAAVGDILKNKYTTYGERPMRLSADNFLVLKPVSKWEEPKEYVQNILDDISKIVIDDKSLNLTAAVGGLLFKASSVNDGHTILDSVVEAKDAARKQTDRPYVFYDEDVVAKHKENNALLEELKEDIKNQKLEVFYQAKYNPQTNKIIGAEALVRWKHGTKGYIPPGVFIPLVEKKGFIWEITQVVFRRVCQDMKEWQERGLPLVPVSVNLSTHDLYQNDLLPFLQEELTKFGIEASLIELEITETSVMADMKVAMQHLRKLKSLGFKLDIDDFGTGYSALSYLQEGIFDAIKLDRSFLVQRDKFQVEGEKLITSIIAMGKSLNLKCICEGAETQEQVDFLRSLEVDAIQGYFYAKPEEESTFAKRLII